ncbi:Dilute class unconventional myosin, partial [Operophtera brumata]
TVNLKSLASSNYGSDVDIINEDGELATAYEAQKDINSTNNAAATLRASTMFVNEQLRKSWLGLRLATRYDIIWLEMHELAAARGTLRMRQLVTRLRKWIPSLICFRAHHPISSLPASPKKSKERSCKTSYEDFGKNILI